MTISHDTGSWAADSHSPLDHIVQFYEDEEFLYSRVADFLMAGIHAGEPAVVIATPEHHEGFRARLDLPADFQNVLFLDARETLSSFMLGDMPDAQRFQQSVGALIARNAAGDRRVRAYGEMVDLLWRDGRAEAAIRLEELWNELGKQYSFSLLCAYPIGNFYKETDSRLFEEICERHSVVVPTETYVSADEDARRREFSALQQRAEALETEIAARHRAEEVNAFLLEASNALNRSLDYDSRLREIVSLAVPRLADSCAVDVARADAKQPPFPRIAGGTTMIVPLLLPDRHVGTLTLTSREPRYSPDDLALAVEFARRSAVALENARLYQAAQEANRVKDEFLATLSHELRTPLTAILGWARMLTLGGLDPQTQRTAFETIERSARTQATLIDDLLDLSRVVTGKLTLQTELVDLTSIIASAVATQRLAAEAKGIAVNVRTGDERAVVMGDPTRLQQIVWNLLSNAIKFSDTGAVVTIELERDVDRARILVRDDGRGISPEFLPHVFEPFRQADGASTRRHGGLGLGLAIVKYLTELHGGTVSASSRGDGRGATFMIALPLALRRSVEADAPVRDEIIDLRGTTILLVDDDAPTRDLVMAMLRRCGAEICTADSVPAARELLIARTPHVIVTDIAMPGHDGFALLDHVRARADAIPVVALTASAPADDESGFAAWVRKPIDPFEFARVIASLQQRA